MKLYRNNKWKKKLWIYNQQQQHQHQQCPDLVEIVSLKIFIANLLVFNISRASISIKPMRMIFFFNEIVIWKFAKDKQWAYMCGERFNNDW